MENFIEDNKLILPVNIQEIRDITLPFIDEPIVNFQIEKMIFDEIDSKKKFNKTIRQKVQDKFGVYVWVDQKIAEIVYIGMAGKVKTDGSLVNHSIKKRLLATRGKDKVTKKDIQTNDYVRNFMTQNEIEVLDIFIIYSKIDEPPAYIEALLLYKYYKQNRKLPRLNNSF